MHSTTLTFSVPSGFSAAAFFADTLTACGNREVVAGERMPLFAVRDTGGPAAGVLRWRNRLHVIRVYAQRVTAQMVNDKAIRDGADDRLVSEVVSLHKPFRVVADVPDSEYAIPLDLCACPNKTGAGGVHEAPEAPVNIKRLTSLTMTRALYEIHRAVRSLMGTPVIQFTTKGNHYG